MEKTKLGLTTGVLGAVTYLSFLFGGYVAGLLILGYILLWEKDSVLKVSAMTALLITLAASIINAVVGLLPDVVNVLESLLNVFKVYFSVAFLDNIYAFFVRLISLLKTVAMLALAGLCLFNKPIQLPVIKKMLPEGDSF